MRLGWAVIQGHKVVECTTENVQSPHTSSTITSGCYLDNELTYPEGVIIYPTRGEAIANAISRNRIYISWLEEAMEKVEGSLSFGDITGELAKVKT